MLYDIGFAIFSLFYLPTLIFKGKLHGDFLERFGAYDAEKRAALAEAKDAIWIQAVSVGEVALCREFIPLVKSRFPGRTIVFSTITKTGNDLAKKLFAKDAVIIYFPLDYSFVVKKALALVKPNIYVMIETEIWPNFLNAVKRNAIPAILINGRISDRSFGKYKLAKPFLRNILKNIDSFCMQSRTDADRIREMGAEPDRVEVTSADIRRELGLEDGDELIVAGSTHPGEEEAVVAAYQKLVKKFPKLKLLIAPRHIERTAEVEAVVRKYGFNAALLSGLPCPLPLATCPSVFILDTIGRLSDFYSVAAIVFIGGSLIKHGGQNPIEPAIYEKPVIFGPHMFNFKNAAELFLAAGGAIRIKDGSGLIPALYNLLTDKKKQLEMGRIAKQVALDNRGATGQNLKEMGRLLDA
jgi:3-deoxy-D-manno-octulosonic-acid transferase